jgi:hypothetical protein
MPRKAVGRAVGAEKTFWSCKIGLGNGGTNKELTCLSLFFVFTIILGGGGGGGALFEQRHDQKLHRFWRQIDLKSKNVQHTLSSPSSAVKT